MFGGLVSGVGVREGDWGQGLRSRGGVGIRG